MLVIVGRGPSIYSRSGAAIDSHTVVRLKDGLHKKADPKHWGSRTDFLCARSLIYRKADYTGEFWHFADTLRWIEYYREFSHSKPSTGLCAVFCAIDRGYNDIALIGFDYMLRPELAAGMRAHDYKAEHAALMKLDITLTELVSGEIHRRQRSGSGDLGGLDDRRPPATISLPAGRRAGAGSRQVRAAERPRGHQEGEGK